MCNQVNFWVSSLTESVTFSSLGAFKRSVFAKFKNVIVTDFRSTVSAAVVALLSCSYCLVV